MLVPFTSPRCAELDALTPDDRATVLRRYASSEDARTIVKKTKMMFAASIVLFILSSLSPRLREVDSIDRALVTVVVVAFGAMAAFTFVAAIVLYRRAAGRAIRFIITNELTQY
jgi:hypothetical protein